MKIYLFAGKKYNGITLIFEVTAQFFSTLGINATFQTFLNIGF